MGGSQKGTVVDGARNLDQSCFDGNCDGSNVLYVRTKRRQNGYNPKG